MTGIAIEVAILTVAVTANLLLLAFVYTRNPRSATHRLFALLTLIMTLWSITNYFSYNVESMEVAKWLVRGVMFFATPMSVVFFLLMHTFPRTTMSLSRRALWIWVGLTLVTMVVTLSPLLFPKVELVPGAAPKPSPGPGMILFIPIGIGTVPLGIYYLIRKLIRARGIERAQIQFLLIGVMIMYALIIGLIFVAVNAYNNTVFIPFAAFFTLPFSLLAAYAIVRYRFLDIRAAITRAVGFTALSGTFFIAYGLGIYLITNYLARFNLSPLQHATIAILGIAIAVPAYHGFRRGLQRITDRFLFQNKIDYGQALAHIGEELTRTIEISEVTGTILDALENILRCRKAAIMLQTGEDNRLLAPNAYFGMENFRVTIPRDNELVQHLEHATSVVVRDELAVLKERETSELHIKELEKIENSLQWLDASIVIPLLVNRRLTGILLVGEKLSGQPYLQEDIEFLGTLAPQAATALENARLYEESRQFGKKLQEEVERATHDLEIANEQLKDLDRAKSEFLSIASHQLYTPLTALRGYLSMMQEGDFGPIAKKQQPVVDILDQSAVRLIDLIRSLLDISRIEAGRLMLNLEEIDIANLAETLVEELLPNARKKGLKLTLHKTEEKVPPVVVDRQRLRQVILNFIDNAIKYTEKGSIEVAITQEKDDVLVSVTDTGRGLTREEINLLFTKFTRVGLKNHTRPEGTGLGLYFAKQIAQEHHGDVTAHSKGHGHGSTFTLRLPAANSPKALKAGETATVEIKAAETRVKNG